MSSTSPGLSAGGKILRGIGLTIALLLGIGGLSYVFVFQPARKELAFKAKRIELLVNVGSIRSAMIAYGASEGSYFSIDRYPKTIGPTPQAWRAELSGGFQKLDWTPSTLEGLGSYSVVATESDFTVHGTCDIDGDGIFAEFSATSTQKPKMKTEGVF